MMESQASATDRFSLVGRVAVVTGGSRGLGAAICTAFAAQGATVVIVSRKQQACDDLATRLQEAGGTAAGFACHVGHWADCDTLIEHVYSQFGRVDVLVNNAGMSPTYGAIGEVSEDLFDKVIAVNLKGPWRLATQIGTRMAASAGGSIINVTSVGAVRPGKTELPYAAAKAGLNNLTIGLSRALGPQVRVNAIMPGAFLTDMSDSWDSSTFDAFAKRKIVLARGGNPDEIVGAALYLASDASSYTTGAVIKVDGGAVYAPA
jgi:NAD(P)-dependent dehydrogenase (short-subunit alcohol dehydrogenase family)